MEDIRNFLINHQVRLQEEAAPYERHYKKMLAEESSIFHNDIVEQYSRVLKNVLSVEIANNTNANPEEVYEFLETFDALTFIGMR